MKKIYARYPVKVSTYEKLFHKSEFANLPFPKKLSCLWPPILLPAYVMLAHPLPLLSLFQRTISIIIFCSILFKLLLRSIAYDATTGNRISLEEL